MYWWENVIPELARTFPIVATLIIVALIVAIIVFIVRYIKSKIKVNK